ncbi:MAG: DUF2953 domain-containing protein [Methanolobus sp.]|nr:DUF2953 domain-containing protein [Methanolobus sp.]
MFLEILIALLIVLLLLVLFVSFHIMLELDKRGEEFQYRILIKWLFLSYSVKPEKFIGREKAPKEEPLPEAKPPEKPVPVKAEKETARAEGAPEKKKPPVSGEKEKEGEKKEKEEPGRWTFRNILKLLRILIVPVIRLLEGILQAIDIHKLKMSLKFGFDDPADTGMVLGYLYALRGYLECQYDRVRLHAEPDFIEMMLDFNVIGDVKFRIANLIPAIVKFIFNRDVLRVSWAIIRKKEIPDPN